MIVVSLSTKARIVAKKSFRQVQGVDYDESFSLVSMLKFVRIMLAIAAFYEIWQMDKQNCKELYTMQLEGFANPKGVN